MNKIHYYITHPFYQFVAACLGSIGFGYLFALFGAGIEISAIISLVSLTTTWKFSKQINKKIHELSLRLQFPEIVNKDSIKQSVLNEYKNRMDSCSKQLDKLIYDLDNPEHAEELVIDSINNTRYLIKGNKKFDLNDPHNDVEYHTDVSRHLKEMFDPHNNKKEYKKNLSLLKIYEKCSAIPEEPSDMLLQLRDDQRKFRQSIQNETTKMVDDDELKDISTQEIEDETNNR